MSKKGIFVIVPAVVLSCSLTHTVRLPAAEQNGSLALLEFGQGFDIGSVVTSDARAMQARAGGLRIETGHQQQWPRITLKAPAGRWDLSSYEYVRLDVKNARTHADDPDVSQSLEAIGAAGTYRHEGISSSYR
ncbi:MAG: hypothetical protein ACYTEK_09325 [Planctomycetota bacterium]|jgi:hypothetical protein